MYVQALTTFWGSRYAVGIGCCLEGLAAVAAASDRVEVAARLVGAADALFETAGAVLEPGERDLHDHTVEAMRGGREVDRFDRLRIEGRAMHLPDAVEYAMRQAE
jgi:hypothetical protein